MQKADIGIIGAMDTELETLISALTAVKHVKVGPFDFCLGKYHGKRVVLTKCGIGKVFASACTEALISSFAPNLVINTGVGGALEQGLKTLDVVIAEKLVQHDMDTSALGDPKGLISGINKIYFETDRAAREKLLMIAKEQGVNAVLGTVATGDRFVADRAEKERIANEFSASACEMEGGAVAQIAYVNNTPFVVIRAISDSADGEATMDYPTFMPIAARVSASLTLALVDAY